MSVTTITNIMVDGQSWHIYRRGEGGPLAISIDCPAQRAHLDMVITPALLQLIGTLMVQAATK